MPSRSAAALIHASNAYLTMGMTEEADGGDESLSRKEGHQQEWVSAEKHQCIKRGI